MADTTLGFRSPFQAFVQDHRFLRALLDEYQGLDPERVHDRRHLLRRIEDEITAHIWTQDVLVFPALAELQDEQVQEDICQSMAEHRALHLILIELREAPTPLLGDLAMVRLHRSIERHLDDEEQKLYPLASRLGPSALDRLSRGLDDRERENESFLEDENC